MPTMSRTEVLDELEDIGKSFFVVNFHIGHFCHKHPNARIGDSVFVGGDQYTRASMQTRRDGMKRIFAANAECVALDLCRKSNPANLERKQKLGVKGKTIVALAKAIKKIHCR